ncbi:MAG TPA: GntR family transcriptional regulator [Nocardioides sp.]
MAPRAAAASAVETITADLRTRILGGDLPAGAPLGEVEVAERYGVSRPTAKAAIENLVTVRLLVRNAHRTARVAALSPDEVTDVYQTRELIESEVVRRLARDRLVPDDAVTANAEIAALLDASPMDIVEPDMRFHTALVDALGSERTGLVYRLLVDEIRLCMTQVQDATLLSNESIAREHAALLDHIAAGRGDDAADQVRAHLTRARHRLAAHLRSL